MKIDKSQQFEDRLARLAIKIIKSIKKIEISCLNQRIISQIIGSSGSIGANYCEANESESKKDFIHKICIAKKETRETKHWLRLLAVSNPEIENELKIYYKEAQELLLIFSKIITTSKKDVNDKSMKNDK
ncbi:four helix bundle protein [Candidatus Shapirobacteria bacterium]|nr:four helix bundle protein [Candidatus Shapirobacteria bacterium]